MKVPNNVVWFEVLLYLSLTLDALSVAFQDRSAIEGDLLAPMILEAGLILLLAYFVHLAAQKRKNWPRWVLAALLVLSIFSLLPVLADNGLIKIDPAKGLRASVIDVTENPKNLKFVELDAAQLPRSLEDVEAAVINTNYAMEAGLNPAKDPLIREGEKAPYFNVIAVRTADKDADWVKELITSYHSPEVKTFIEETFKGSVQPAW